MNNFFKTLANHKWAIIFAVLIGLIIAFPQAYFRYDHRDIYQGIDILRTDAEAFYMSRIKEVRDGHLSISNSQSALGKDFPYLWTPLSEIIASFLGQIFFLDIKNTILLERFLFPSIIFLLVYVLVYGLSQKKLIALLAASAVLLSDDLLDPRVFLDFLFHQEIPGNSFLLFGRLINPSVHSIFFFSFLLCFWLFLEKEKKIYGFISSIILGLSFYSYPYTWSFLYAFLGILILIFGWQKKWAELKNILLIILGSLIVALPYFWNLFRLLNHPFYPAISARFGMIETYQPQFGLTVLLLLLLFFLFFPAERSKRYCFSLALVLAPLVVLNQQIVTGVQLLSGHYHWYFIKPLAVIFLVMIAFHQLNQWIKKSERRMTIQILLAGLLLLILFGHGILLQINSYLRNQEQQREMQRFAVSYQWLDKNTQGDEVILSDAVFSRLLPVYTDLNPLLGYLSAYHLVPEDYLTDGLFTEYRLNGLKAEQAFERFKDERAKISARLYGQFYRRNFGGLENIGEIELLDLAKQYSNFLSVSFFDILQKYKVSYIVWDTLNHPNWQLGQYPFLRQVYENNGLVVYQIQQKNGK